MKKIKDQNGFSMIELLVAVGVVVLVLVAVSTGVSVSVRNTRFSSEKSVTVRYAQEAVEWLRNQRDILGWRAFYEALDNDNVGGSLKYCLQGLGDTSQDFIDLLHDEFGCDQSQLIDNVYAREADLVLDPSGNEIEVSVSVSWDDGSGNKVTTVKSTLRDWE